MVLMAGRCPINLICFLDLLLSTLSTLSTLWLPLAAGPDANEPILGSFLTPSNRKATRGGRVTRDCRALHFPGIHSAIEAISRVVLGLLHEP